MENKTVFCPICQRQVTGDECFDISMVAEGTTPDRFLPEDLKPEEFDDRPAFYYALFLLIKASPFQVASFSYNSSRNRPANRRNRKACGSHGKDSGERSSHDH